MRCYTHHRLGTHAVLVVLDHEIGHMMVTLESLDYCVRIGSFSYYFDGLIVFDSELSCVGVLCKVDVESFVISFGETVLDAKGFVTNNNSCSKRYRA